MSMLNVYDLKVTLVMIDVKWLLSVQVNKKYKRKVKTMEKKLYRVTHGKKLAGVCGGFAEYFNIDPTLIRLGWALLVICGGVGLLAYIVCAFVIPNKPE